MRECKSSKSKSQACLRPDPCHLALACPVCACLLQPRLSLPVVLPDVNTAHLATPCGLQFWLSGSELTSVCYVRWLVRKLRGFVTPYSRSALPLLAAIYSGRLLNLVPAVYSTAFVW